ncbi:uncharacterized protein DFL_009359 [Arthrobotrys flagrans]|uniref:PIN domain-containing protein n=1 Tax=Arthrobotrys flagrans TaxID=97331 RepID=A0A436ZRJ5_ARTFL|nr:hypothetical protein DFL_009359 [Arthrobotrys flagrans]
MFATRTLSPMLRMLPSALLRPFSKSARVPVHGCTGSTVPQHMFDKGELGRILLDTNIVSPVLDGKPLSPWFENVLQKSSLATCQYNIAEYLTSAKVGTKMSYQDILKSLENQKINILNGPCAGHESSVLGFELIQMTHKGMLTKPKTFKGYEKSKEKAQKHWDGIADARIDLVLACEAHHNRYAFLTADKNFYNKFKQSLDEKNVTVYCVELEALTSTSK